MIKDSNWESLFKLAMWCSILMAAIIPVQIAVYVISPPPSTVEGFYNLYNESRLLGLLSLDLLYMINTVILIPIYMALLISLQGASRPMISLAAVISLIGIVSYFPSNVSLEMMGLSSKYFAADSFSQKQIILAAGEAAMARYTGTAFAVYYILNAIVLIIISVVMLKSKIYSKATGLIGLLSGILMSVPSTFGTIGLIFSLLSLIPWIVFTLLLIPSFKRMAAGSSSSAAQVNSFSKAAYYR